MESHVLVEADLDRCNEQGLEKLHQQQYPAALACFEQALAIEPHPVVAYNAGNAACALGQYEKAERYYQQALEQGFVNAAIVANLGAVYHKMKRPQQALDQYSRALAMGSDPDILFNLYLLYRDVGQLDVAEEGLLELVKNHPHFAAAHANLSEIFYLTRQYDQAAHHASQAIACDPLLPEPYINLGKVYMKKGRYQDSIALFEQACQIQGPCAEFLCNLASAHIYLSNPDPALVYLKQAYDLNPRLIQIPLHLARVARLKGEYAAEQECREKALSNIEPHQAKLAQAAIAYEFDYQKSGVGLDEYKDLMIFYFDYALFCFGIKDYAQAWPYYDLRWETPDSWGMKKPFSVPCLQHADQPTQVVWAWGEQGLGDTIMFANLLRAMEAQGKRYILAVEGRLATLMARSFHPEQVVSMRKDRHGEQALPESVSHHIPLGSLYRLVDYAHFEQVVDPRPYLCPDPAQYARMQAYCAGFSGPVVGISWKSFNETCGKSRSLDPDALITLLSVPGIHWVSLQYGIEGSEQQALQAAGITLHPPPVDVFNDIEGLAALLAAMDATVTVDNTTAHLAGAVGAPTWILLNAYPDWRWSRSGDRTIWYQTARLWRQVRPQSWDEPIAAIRDALQAAQQSGCWDMASEDLPWKAS